MRETLRKIGLVEEEINIYLLLLKLGSSKATKLSKELRLARSTVYRFLDSLLEKGLISENIVNNVKFFTAVSPERIPEILEERADEIKSIIPKLNSLIGREHEEAKVELFKGKEGIKTVMNDIIKEGKDYTFLGEAEKFFHEIEFFTFQWIKKVEEKKIKGRLLCSKEQKFEIAKTEKLKFLDKELIPEITTWTYGNKTAFIIMSEQFDVVFINTKPVKKRNKKLFDYLWKIDKK